MSEGEGREKGEMAPQNPHTATRPLSRVTERIAAGNA